MKILIVHNTYQQRGGEDTAVAAEHALLRRAGHQVHLETVSNDVIAGLVAKLRAFVSTPYDPARKKWMRGLLQEHDPDVVHIHNFFPLLTPAIHQTTAEMGVAVVQTLHNFRILCAGSQFLRDGQVCEKCLSGARYWGVAHRCYRKSALGSLAVVRMQERAFRHEIWHRYVHRFVTLSAFSRSKFVAGGLPADRLVIKPNFADDPGDSNANRTGALFVGRLSPEKGVDILLSAWKKLPHIPLTIVGDGPERDRLKAGAPGNVRFLGWRSREDVAALMQKAAALIQPSVCYENFPLTVAEAFASGLPVIASKIGALGEIVEPNRNGAHFRVADAADLARTVDTLFATPTVLADLGKGARNSYAARYTPEANLSMLESIYVEAIAEARKNPPDPAGQPG